MTKARIAVGTGAAVLVVGAIVHLKPSSKLTSESFVSAVFTNTPGVGVTGTAAEIEKLPVCKFNTVAWMGFQTVAGAWDKPLTPDQDVDTTYGDASKEFYTTDVACTCGKFAATRGRVCEASGNANPKGQSYLPRCPAKTKEIYQSYTAGCWCGVDEDFTTANSAKSVGPDVTVSADVAVAATPLTVEAAACTAGGPVCVKGEVCATGPKCVAPDGTENTIRKKHKYAWAIPKIVPNAKDEKFTICKSTNLQKQKCDATTSTAQTGNKPVCQDA